eukprot:scaffold21499_cov60-Attheya_sp.AAC.2
MWNWMCAIDVASSCVMRSSNACKLNKLQPRHFVLEHIQGQRHGLYVCKRNKLQPARYFVLGYIQGHNSMNYIMFEHAASFNQDISSLVHAVYDQKCHKFQSGYFILELEKASTNLNVMLFNACPWGKVSIAVAWWRMPRVPL